MHVHPLHRANRFPAMAEALAVRIDTALRFAGARAPIYEELL